MSVQLKMTKSLSYQENLLGQAASICSLMLQEDKDLQQPLMSCRDSRKRKMIVIDTSVIFKWFDKNEEGRNAAADILQKHLLKKQEVIDKALLLYLDNLHQYKEFKKEMKAWDLLSEEAWSRLDKYE